MDPEAFLEMANTVTKMKMYPYFEVAHAIVTCLYMREDLGQGAHAFSRKHPLSNWVSCMCSIFAGGFMAAFLLGEPILGAVKNTNQVVLATAVWYLIFYSPMDVCYKLFKIFPIKLVVSAMKEVIRCKKVHDGVVHAAKVYPNAYLVMVIIGTIKGNGAAFLKLFERALRGTWTTTPIEVLTPTFATKASIAASVVFVLDKKTELISAPHALVYFGVVIFFVYFKLSSLLLGIHDPFVPFENLFCTIFMGGMWDSLARMIGRDKQDPNNPKIDLSRNGKTDAAKKKE